MVEGNSVPQDLSLQKNVCQTCNFVKGIVCQNTNVIIYICRLIKEWMRRSERTAVASPCSPCKSAPDSLITVLQKERTMEFSLYNSI